VIRVEVGKRNEDHENDGQQRKQHQRQHGHGEQGYMKALIRQAVQVVPEARDFPPLPQILLGVPGIPDVRVPNVQEHRNHRQRQHAVEKNQHGVVAGESLIYL